MASLPPQQHHRRASPPTEPASPEQSHAARTNSFSAASVDSQTLLLNSPPTKSAKPAEAAQPHVSVQTESQPTEDSEPRRCWICFNDETEDDEMTSEWRSPCPCVLVAHEKCLLDWVADMEAPSSRRRAGRTAGKILCPQCKSEIRLERPRSLVVETVRTAERLTKLMVLPGIFFLVGSATVTVLRLIGTSTVFMIFGIPDGRKILQPVYTPLQPSTNLVTFALNHLRNNWQLDLGLPAIPTILILSRTRIADSFLPFLPLVFFASGGGGGHHDSLLQFTWPPSAAFTVAALPYVRSIYNSYYDRFWLRHERRWLKEVQPRADAEDEIDAGAQGEDDAEAILNAIVEEDRGDEDADDVVELEVDVDLLFDWHGGGPADNHHAPENPPVPIARGPAAPPLEAPPVDDEAPGAAEVNQEDDAAPAPNVPQQPAQARRQRVRRERNIGFATASISDSILGALVFPTIAAAMGEVLKAALPKSWVTPPTSGKPTGFLQNKWARSIVGGCLFVGLKDAMLLYVRWKMAQTHRQRRVVDYEGSKGKRKNKPT